LEYFAFLSHKQGQDVSAKLYAFAKPTTATDKEAVALSWEL